MKRILILEDDKDLGTGVSIALRTESIETVLCDTIAAASEKLKSDSFDLALVDVNLPDGNGLDFLQQIKSTSNLPVILLTAHDLETDIVVGLEAGADDYVTKPFSLAILRARVNTQLKREIPAVVEDTVIGGFRFQFDKMEFFKDDVKIELSKSEQKLLRVLVENKGMVVAREILIDRLWDNDADFVDENALSVTIKRLRDKLEGGASKVKYIKTVYGLGYMWAGDHDEP